MKRPLRPLVLFSLFVFGLQPLVADSFRLGNPQLVPSGLAGVPGGSFANATFTTNGTIPTSTAPFGSNNPCGADNSLASPGNCNTNWTFTYSAYSSITSASVTLGLLGLDSANTGDQVALFTLATGSGFDLTSAFSVQAETTNISSRATCSVNGVSVTKCPEYNIYQINITDSLALAALEGGTATFDFTMAGPGTGAFGSTTHNGAILDFSELDITGTHGTTPPPNVPEPSSLVLLASGVMGLATKIARLGR